MFKYFKKYKIQVLFSVLLIVLESLCVVYSLFVLMFMFNSILDSNIKWLLIWSATCVIATILSLIIGICLNYYNEKVSQVIILDMKIELINKLSLINYTDIQDQKIDYHSMFINDIGTLETNFFGKLSDFLSGCLTLVFCLAIMFYFSYILGLVTIVFLLLYACLPFIINKYVKKSAAKFNQNQIKYSDKTKKILEAINTLFFANKLHLLSRLLNKENEKIANANVQYVAVLKLKVFLFGGCLFTFQTLLILITVVLQVSDYINSNLGIGIILSVTSLSNNLFRSSNQASDNYVEIKSTKIIFDKWKNINLFYQKRQNQINKISTINSLVLKHINYFTENKKILKNFNFTVNKYNKYLFIGKSGSGKSTVAKIVLNLVEPTLGFLECNGRSVKGCECQKNIISKVCYVEATPSMLEDTVKNNIILYDQNFNKTRYETVLKLLNLEELEQDKVIDEKNFNLSTGQKQRINIARSLYKNYDFIIFDEAMSNIDAVTSEKIEKYLLNDKEKTFINITHHTNDKNQNLYNEVINFAQL